MAAVTTVSTGHARRVGNQADGVTRATVSTTRVIYPLCEQCGHKGPASIGPDREGRLCGVIFFTCKFCKAYNIKELADLQAEVVALS